MMESGKPFFGGSASVKGGIPDSIKVRPSSEMKIMPGMATSSTSPEGVVPDNEFAEHRETKIIPPADKNR